MEKVEQLFSIINTFKPFFILAILNLVGCAQSARDLPTDMGNLPVTQRLLTTDKQSDEYVLACSELKSKLVSIEVEIANTDKILKEDTQDSNKTKAIVGALVFPPLLLSMDNKEMKKKHFELEEYREKLIRIRQSKECLVEDGLVAVKDESTKTINQKVMDDYFNNDFLRNVTSINGDLKEKILQVIEYINFQLNLNSNSSATLDKHSINSSFFKGNNYLRLTFSIIDEYNSLKLNKYDIGKLFFDNVIKKVLTPLNEHIGESKLFYGYDISVLSFTKDFANKYTESEIVTYRFLISAKIARQYKEKEISGQKVLDTSIILMDDERVELKLQ